MSINSFTNEDMSSKLMLMIIKEYGRLLTNSNSILYDSNNAFLGNTQSALIPFANLGIPSLDLEKGKEFLLGSLKKNETLKKIKEEIIYDLLDNTLGAYFLQDIIDGKAFPLKDSYDKYFIVEREKPGSVNISKMVTPLKSIKINGPITLTSTKEGVKNKTLQNYASIDYSKDNVYINQASQANRKFPSLGAIVIKNRSLGLPTRNADHLNIFFNAIPNIELSRCAPYINMAFITRAGSGGTSKISSIAYMRFIKKNKGDDFFSMDQNLGLDTAFPTGMQDLLSKTTNTLIDDTDIALMDILTSPQTLANGDINNPNFVNDAFGKSNFKGTDYNFKVLDPITPFLTLSDVSVDMSGMGGTLYTQRVGSINLKLHDRSRLGDISDLVATNNFGTTKIIIEFGWSHPDGHASSNNIIGQFLNGLRDRAIYTLKSTNFNFGGGNVVDISMALTAFGGQNSKYISCASGSKIPITAFRDLINKINTDITDSYISKLSGSDKNLLRKKRKEVRKTLLLQRENSISTQRLIKYTDYVKLLKIYEDNSVFPLTQAKKDNLITQYQNILGISDPNDTSKTIDQIEKDNQVSKKDNQTSTFELMYGKMYALHMPPIKSIVAADVRSSFAKRIENLQEQLASASEEEVVEIGDEFKSLQAEIDKFDNVQENRDFSFLKEDFLDSKYMAHDKMSNKGLINFGGEKNKTLFSPSIEHLQKIYPVESKKFVTMGKIIMSFMGHSLAMSGLYDEVQVVFYPFNTKSGGARVHTTASLPIDALEFERKLINRLEENANLSVEGFFSFFEKNFIRDENLDIYGIGQAAKSNRMLIESKNKEIEKIQKKMQVDHQKLIEKQTAIVNDKSLSEEDVVSQYNDINKQIEELSKVANEQKKPIIESIKETNQVIDDEVQTFLTDLYNKDGGPPEEPKFKRPNLSLYYEVLTPRTPSRNVDDEEEESLFQKIKKGLGSINLTNFEKTTAKKKSGIICRVHIYDEETDAHPRKMLINKMFSEGDSGKIITKSHNYNMPDDIEDMSETESFLNKISLGEKLETYVSNMTADDLRKLLKKSYPSITYGANNSTIENLSVSSNTSDKVSQVLMLRSYINRNNPLGGNDSKSQLQETRVVPASVNLSMTGMPMIGRGNQIFIDFGTNTTLDNVYTVRNVSHNISSGKFKTDVALIPAGQGETSSLMGEILETLKALKK